VAMAVWGEDCSQSEKSEKDGVAWAQEDRWAGAEQVNDLREVTKQQVH
jgi:hypothetical protein